MSDPATEWWREAMGQSTGARLRRALEANEELARELADVIVQNAVLSLENKQLRARISRQRGAYHLTEKGRAATEPATEEKP